MKVLYDHQIFSSQVFGGISRYFYELMRRFANDDGIEIDLALCFSNNSYLQESGFVSPRSFFKDKKFVGRTTLLECFNGLKSRRSLLSRDYDVFHPTYYNPYFMQYVGCKPFVVTVYDMVHELYPEMYPQNDGTREWKRQSLQRAAKVIAISENTRRDLIRIYDMDGEKIEVIPLASSLSTADDPAVCRVPGKYILYVGQRVRYKNFPFFIRSVAPLLLQNRELTVFCAGGGGFGPDEISLAEGLGISGQVLQGGVSDESLASLYKNASVFVFPSVYEGFGIPILEAFSCGCPVTLSNTSCFPEVAGDAALYFDPHDERSLRSAVEKIIFDESLSEDLRIRGYARAREFSWDKTTIQTKAIYKSLV